MSDTVSISKEDLQKMIQDAVSASAASTRAAAPTPKPTEWEPPADKFVPNQRAYDDAPPWVPGATYWKTGSKPEGSKIL